jgi:hydroxymethylbilane synthase
MPPERRGASGWPKPCATSSVSDVGPLVSLRVATRGSALARWQAEHVAGRLRAVDPSTEVELVVVETYGDRRTDVPLSTLGGKGVFVKEVQAAVLDGRADLAVHSAKDLPALTPPGLALASVPERGDPRDALVGSSFDDLPTGARVGTGSARRRAQLAWLRPDLTFADLRGNIATRLDKASGFDAVVIAAAALDRLDLLDRAAEILDPELMVPQVGQGALAVECREGASTLAALLATIEDPTTRRAVDTERAFLAELGGDCDLPAGAYATVDGSTVQLEGFLASLDGRVMLRTSRRGEDPDAVGRSLARHLLDDAGGSALLGPRPGAGLPP